MSEDSIIVLRQITKSYTKGKVSIPIFEDLDLDIDEGDFVAIMGPSGSGKTTLLNLLGGIDKPTSGQYRFNGQTIDGLSESQLSRWRSDNVGFVFQHYNLMPMLTGARNVELPLLLTRLNRSERAEHVHTALEIVGLEDRAKHKPAELSGGEQQRIAIARAIVSDPRLLLCDEPTGDLDRDTANQILGTLQLLNHDFGKTIVMVTHDPEAAKYASHTLILDKGQFSGEVAA